MIGHVEKSRFSEVPANMDNLEAYIVTPFILDPIACASCERKCSMKKTLNKEFLQRQTSSLFFKTQGILK